MFKKNKKKLNSDIGCDRLVTPGAAADAGQSKMGQHSVIAKVEK